MESKIPIWKFPFGVGVYHLNNIPNLPKEPWTSLTSSKWLLKDASIDEELLLDYEKDGEFHLISATAAFMKRYLKRIVGFCEAVCRLMQSMSSDRTFE